MKRWQGLGAFIFIFVCYLIVGTLEYKNEMAIAEHNQQIEAAYAEIQFAQSRINELKVKLEELEEYTQAVSANLGDLRFRLGMEMEP